MNFDPEKIERYFPELGWFSNGEAYVEMGGGQRRFLGSCLRLRPTAGNVQRTSLANGRA